MERAALVVIVLVALGFDFTNGFHDAANAIATSVSTRALTPQGNHGLLVVFAALIGAIAWNLLTWRFGLSTSSSHALIGGLVGAAIGAAVGVQWTGLLDKVLVPMVVSPIVGVAGGYLLHVGLMWLLRHARPGPTSRRFRLAQSVSAAGMGLGHGLQDAQKTMGVIVLGPGHGRLAAELPRARVGHRQCRAGDGAGHLHLRLAHHPHARPADRAPRPSSRLRRRNHRRHRPGRHRLRLARPGLHHPHHHLSRPRRRRDPPTVRWRVAFDILAAWLLTIPGAATAAGLAYLLLHRIIPS